MFSSPVKQDKFALVVGVDMIVSGRASSSVKKDASLLFCLKAQIVINNCDMFDII